MNETSVVTATTTARRVYCDGGVIGKNPSALGGTWAFCFVSGEEGEEEEGGGGGLVLMRSGVVTPEQAGVPKITNNLTELLAAVEALEAAPSGWAGTLFTDSYVTLCRLTNPKAGMKGIPEALQARLRAVKARLGPGGAFRAVLLDGHPTKAHLAAGVGKRGSPVSGWNVLCDKECGRLAREFKERMHP